MNSHDKQNLEFLLSIPDEALTQWFKQASDDDIAYAFEIMAQAKTETLCELFALVDDVEDVSEANAYLSQFRINK